MHCFSLKEYQTASLPLAVWEMRSFSKDQEEHSHDCFEIMFITSGCGCCVINGRGYPMIRGDFYIMQPEDFHAFTIEGDFCYYNIMFSADLFSETELQLLRQFRHFSHWLERGNDEPRKYNFAPFDCEKLVRLLARVSSELELREIGFELNAKAFFIEFLIHSLRNLEQVLPPRNLREKSAVARVIDRINHHCTEKLTTAQLAAGVCVSASYLGELFRKETGMSLFDYIGRVRVDKARLELENSDDPISEIALRLGYYDSSYFSRSFRTYTGMTPREYRKLLDQRILK